MTPQVKETKEILKSHNLKSTPQRVVIYEVMKKLGHASADTIYQEIKSQFHTMTVATVYNVLDSFVGAGLLHRRMSSNNKMYFDVNTYTHCHLYSPETNVYVDYDDSELIRMVGEHLKKRKITNFELTDIDIQLVGNIKQL